MKLFFTIGLLFCAQLIAAQLSLSLGYTNLNAQEWDEAFHQYNFSHPWNEEKLPPLIHGYQAKLGYLVKIKPSRSIYLKPEFGFNRYQSKANNFDEITKVRLDIYSLHASLNFNPKGIFRRANAGPIGTRFFMFVNFGMHLLSPYSQKGDYVYNEQFDQTQDTKSLTWSFGGGLGYRTLLIAKKIAVTPYAGARIIPNAYNKNLPYYVAGGDQTYLNEKARMALIWDMNIEFVWIFPSKKQKQADYRNLKM